MENGNENADSPSDEQLKAEVEKVLDGIDNAFSIKDLLTELREFPLAPRFLLCQHRVQLAFLNASDHACNGRLLDRDGVLEPRHF